jgi:hypothetical protein
LTAGWLQECKMKKEEESIMIPESLFAHLDYFRIADRTSLASIFGIGMA